MQSDKKMIVTPWEVSGHMDYDRLVKEFGTTKIANELERIMEKTAGESNLMLRR